MRKLRYCVVQEQINMDCHQKRVNRNKRAASEWINSESSV